MTNLAADIDTLINNNKQYYGQRPRGPRMYYCPARRIVNLIGHVYNMFIT